MRHAWEKSQYFNKIEEKKKKSRVRKAEFVKLTKLTKKFDDVHWCWSVGV